MMLCFKKCFTREDGSAGTQHECELVLENNDFANAPEFNTGYCISLRRFLMSSILIWRFNSASMKTYRSDAMISQFNIKQLRLRRYVIHPYSMIRTFWEIIMIVVYFISFMLPINKFLKIYEWHYLQYALMAFKTMAIMINFSTGYMDAHGNIVMSRRKINRHYALTSFVPDLLSASAHLFFEDCIFAVSGPLRYCQFFILLSLWNFRQLLNNFENFIDAYAPKRKRFRLGITLFVALVWIPNLYYVADFPDATTHNEIEYHVSVCYRIFANLFLMGYYAHYDNTEVVITDSISLIIGFIVKLIIIKFIYHLHQRATYLNYKILDVLKQIDVYASLKRLPESIRHRMRDQILYMNQQHKFLEACILNNMSHVLRHEVLAFQYAPLLERSTMFAGMPMHIILRVTYKLTTALYMPTEVIVREGTTSDMMYFIKSGMAAIYTPTGKEICHLSEGSSFGELMVIASVRNATVVAIDWCEMCKLSRADLFAVFEDYPELMRQIRTDVQRRAANMATSDSRTALDAAGSDSDSTDSTASNVVHI